MTDTAAATTRHLARGGVLGVAGTAVTSVAGFGLTLLVARGIPDVGKAGAFLSATALFSIVSKVSILGANTGLVKFLAVGTTRHGDGEVPDARGLIRAAVLPVALLGIALGLAGWFGADALASTLASPAEQADFATFTRRFAIFLPVASVAGVYLGASRGWSSMVPTTLYENIMLPVGQVTLVGAAFLFGLGADVAAAVYWAPWVAVLLATWWWTRQRVVAMPPPSAPAPWRSFWRFSLPHAAARIFNFLLARADVLMLGALASSAQAGIYTAAIRYLTVPLSLQWALYQPFEPEISRLLEHGTREESSDQFHVMTTWSVLVNWPVLLVLMVHGEALLRIFGGEYAAGATALAIIATSLLLATTIGSIDVVLIMSGRSGWSMFNTAVVLGVNVGLNLVLIPIAGIEGAAIAWAVGIVLGNALPLWQVRRWVGIQPFSRNMGRAVVASLTCFGVIGVATRLLLGPTFVALVVGGLVGSVAYLLVARWQREAFRIDELLSAVRPGAATTGV